MISIHRRILTSPGLAPRGGRSWEGAPRVSQTVIRQGPCEREALNGEAKRLTWLRGKLSLIGWMN